mmetsp:Transcript_13759/g.18785  ORF Transcript_13759/g.18785 Transcript_13759/m.18785 type:complete len:92 (+) Transcript_13759:1030-1305(+)
MVMMEEIVYEEDAGTAYEVQEEAMNFETKKAPAKRQADKAAAPVRKTLRYSLDGGQTNETFGPRELFKAQQPTSMRKRPYVEEEEEEVFEI